MSLVRSLLGTPSLSRRQWLRSTGLVAGGSVALPTLLPALGAPLDDIEEALRNPASLVRHGHTTAEGFAVHERAMAALRRAEGPIRLSSNENPYGMAPSAKAAINSAWAEHNKYGAASPRELEAVFAKAVGVPKESVLVTAGSSEVLSVAALAYGLHGGEILSPWPTFEGLPRYAERIGATMHLVPLDANHAHDLTAMDQRLVQAITLVFVCNPNNPTGTLTDAARLRSFVESAARRTTVLVDEAYHDFVDDPSYRSMTDLVLKGENVIISRTASKIHGLAGLRTGFAIARPDIIERMRTLATSAPGVFGARGAIASIGDASYQDMCKQRNREGRSIMTTALAALGRKHTASHTNFVFFHAGMPAAAVQQRMLAKGFLIGRAFPPYNDWARISIGTPEEMRQVAQLLPEVLRA
jgi:histidinol-phosphate aminotransferase